MVLLLTKATQLTELCLSNLFTTVCRDR